MAAYIPIAKARGITPLFDKYSEIIKDFIANNPQRTIYVAAGWTENDEYVTNSYLYEIYSDKPLIMNIGGWQLFYVAQHEGA